MRLRWAMAIAVVAAVPAVLGQQPPEASDPEAVLKRTRERLLADLDRLPRYTCVQTITRRYYRAPGGGHSCARLIEEHESRKKELPLDGWDRLRLEVAIAEGQNVYSWVGASKFETGNIEELAGHGPLGSGDFGTFLDAVLRRATVSFHEEKVVGGRHRLEYSYDMPTARSGYMVKTSAGWTPTAYSGSFLLDPGAADVVSLTVRTVELPESNPACQAISEVEYGRTMIHDRMILVPQKTRLNVIDRPGSETVNVTEYENCREYSSKSRILESAPSETATAVQPQSAAPAALSPNLRFECRIVTPIDSDTAAAGDPIEGILLSPIHDKQNNNLLVSAGARLRGRLMLVQHRSGAFETIRISVQWKSIEVNGRDVPLHATPDFSKMFGHTVVVPDFDSLGQGIFLFRKKHVLLHEWEWTWTTQALDSYLLNLSSSTTMLPFTVEVAEAEFPIQAGSAVHFKVSVPSGASGVLLEGTFTATGGHSNDMAVSLFSSDQFAKLQDQETATALYESGRIHQGELNVKLPPDAGTYYLVFSNDFPLSTPKVVQASIRLHYKL